MDFETLILRVALALGIGLLVGLERGWRARDVEPGGRTAGIRTFGISGLLGGIIGAIAAAAGTPASVGGGIIIALGFAAYAIAITVFSREENMAEGTFSATTAVAGMLTFALGVYALLGDVRIAAAAAVAATGVLAIRETLHGWVQKMTWEELRSGLVLLSMTFIALPVMPETQIGPFGGINPREVWIIAIVLGGVAFFGYVAVKYMDGSRGFLLAAAAGGLVSSTAVTLANAERARRGEGVPHLLAAGVAVATAISFLRVLAIATALRPALFKLIAPPLLIAASIAVSFALIPMWRKKTVTREQTDVRFRNPFSFWSVIGFAFLLGTIILLGRVVAHYFGAVGVVVGATLVGFADIDSVAVSMTHLVPTPLAINAAAIAILASVVSNTISKVAIAFFVGHGRFAAATAAMALLCILAGAFGVAFILAFVK